MAEAATRSASRDVHHDCLKGHYFLDKMTEEDTRKAVGCFEAALVEEESCRGLAYAGLAHAWCEFARLSMMPSRAAGAKAKEFAILSLSYDSQSAAAHVAMARVRMLFDWDWKRARSEFARSLELDARSASAHRFYASFLTVMEETDQALEQMQMAQAIQPLSLPLGVEHAWLLYAARNFEAAAERCWKVLALEPRFWPAQLALGLAYRQLGMREEAIAELENAVVCSGRNPMALGALGYLNGANEVLEELNEQAKRRYVNPLSYALAHEGLQQDSPARDWLTRAYAERDPNLLWLNHRSAAGRFRAASVT